MKITNKDKKRIREFYKEKLEKFGSRCPRSLNWNNEFTQFTRFKVLAGISDLNGKSILDVGCGLGDFYFYLKQNVNNFTYMGIDIVPELIEDARKKYPKASFKCDEIYNMKNLKYDFVFASGVFSFKIDEHKQKYFSMIRRMYDISRIGVGFNMLVSSKHIDNEIYTAYKPKEIFKECMKLTPDVKIIEGYLLWDFTVYMYKQGNT